MNIALDKWFDLLGRVFDQAKRREVKHDFGAGSAEEGSEVFRADAASDRQNLMPLSFELFFKARANEAGGASQCDIHRVSPLIARTERYERPGEKSSLCLLGIGASVVYLLPMLVTVAIPVYNRENLIRSTIQSALQQDLQGLGELEVLVIDNCSTDKTWDVIQSIRDPRLRAIRNDSNVGMFGNFNRCKEEARGQFVRFLCSDDSLAENCLAEEVRTLLDRPGASVLNTRGVMVDDRGQELYRVGTALEQGEYSGPEAIRAAVLLLAKTGQNLFNFPSGILIRASVIKQAGDFDPSVHGLADFQYWLRLLEHGDLIVSDSVGCRILEHPGRESYPLFYSGQYILGQLMLVRDWSRRLKLTDEQVRSAFDAMGARCLWYVVRCASAGKPQGIKAHLRMFSEFDLNPLRAFGSLMMLGTQRLLGKRAMPGAAQNT